MTTSPHAPAVDPLHQILELCDVLREVESLPDGQWKELYRLEACVQLRYLVFVLLLWTPENDSLTTHDHLKEARHN